MLVLKGLIRGTVQILLFAGLLLLPADTWNWPRAQWFLLVYGALIVMSVAVLARFAPKSLEARLQPPASETQPTADRVITLLMILSILGWVAFVPVDVFHLELLPKPPMWLSGAGLVVFILGFGTIMAAQIQNAFVAPVVQNQSERGHSVIDSGLYGHIRHPLYLGLLLFLAGMGLWLESLAALVVLPAIAGLLVARIMVEEKTLRQSLSGYSDYMEKVPHRLIPYIW